MNTKQVVILLLAACLAFSGCTAWPSSANSEGRHAAGKPIVRLADANFGRIVRSNSEFAVLVFPFGGVPSAGQRLNVYRHGKKVGELKVTGPRRDFNTVADVISGEAQLNDEVRTD